MKKVLMICWALTLCVAVAGDLRVPSSAFEIGELEEAKTEAQKKDKPLIFVYTDPESK